MTDAELIALSAVVNQETILMDADNKQRESFGYAPCYVCGQETTAWRRLYEELERRKEVS